MCMFVLAGSDTSYPSSIPGEPGLPGPRGGPGNTGYKGFRGTHTHTHTHKKNIYLSANIGFNFFNRLTTVLASMTS